MVLATYYNGSINIPIGDTDNAIGSFTWRYLMDVYTANNGHTGVTKAKLKKELRNLMKEIETDLYDTFDIVADTMVDMIKKEM